MDRRLFLGASAACMAAPTTLMAADGPIELRDLYNEDRSFSDLAKSLDGERVDITGFMAPPLKADSTFFVLTRRPMSACPFCSTTAEWPDDVLAIYTKRRVRVMPFNVKIDTRGILEFGEFIDPDSGFASPVRLVNAIYV